MPKTLYTKIPAIPCNDIIACLNCLKKLPEYSLLFVKKHKNVYILVNFCNCKFLAGKVVSEYEQQQKIKTFGANAIKIFT